MLNKNEKFNYSLILKLISEEGSISKLLPSIMEREPNYVALGDIGDVLRDRSVTKYTSDFYFSRLNSADDKLLFGIMEEDTLMMVGDKGNIVEVSLPTESKPTGSVAALCSHFENINKLCSKLNHEVTNRLSAPLRGVFKKTSLKDHEGPVTFDSDDEYQPKPM